jgi:lysophospholipase L1-like esterase
VGNKFKSRLKLVAGQTVIFLVLLLAIDLFLWVAIPIEKGLEKRQTIRFTQDEQGLKPEITYTQIGDGLRSLSMKSLQKPNNALRILCLGASTTNQSTQETKDTWCGILDRNLRASYPRANIQTVSYGKGGDTSIATALWIKHMAGQLKPDIVITLLGINDLTWRGGPGYRIGNVGTLTDSNVGILSDSKEKSSIFRALKDLCTDISQICRRLGEARQNLALQAALRKGTKVNWHSANLPNLRRKYRELPYVGDLARVPDPIDEFQGALDWLLGFFQQRSMSVIVLGQPTLWKSEMTSEEYDRLWFSVHTPSGPVRPSTSWLSNEMRKYNNVQKTEAKKFGFEYVELDDLIPKSLDYYFDDCHFTDKGSKRVAEVVLPTLKELLETRQASLVDR